MDQFGRTNLVLICMISMTEFVGEGAGEAYRNRPSCYLRDVLILPLLYSKRIIFLSIYKMSIIL